MSEKKYRLLACDIDGTLLNKDKEISGATKKAFKRLADQDTQIVLVSARMPRAMRYLQKELNILHMPSIAYNGGIKLKSSAKPDDYLSSDGLPVATASQIVDLLEGTDIHPGLYSDDDWVVTKKDGIVEKEIFNTKTEPEIAQVSETLKKWGHKGKVVHKIMLMGPDEHMQQVHKRIEESSLSGFSIYESKSHLFEIISDNTSKDKALTSLCEFLDIPMEETVAIGDNDNDLGMIKVAGCGVSMGNGRDELKKVADMVTDANTEDGVATALQKLFF
ncbi:MAG: Cof-type HAD-IIB family hydrolase [Cyclobacteriaceae bacterium]